jgi:hypothetical protein
MDQTITINLKKPFYKTGRIHVYGIALNPKTLDEMIEADALTLPGSRAAVGTLLGAPVITLEVVGINEMRMAMTPLAWVEMLVEKRRELIKTSG